MNLSLCKSSGLTRFRLGFEARNALLLLFVMLCIWLTGCIHRTDQAVNLFKIERVDNDTNLKVTYTAYKRKSGYEMKHGAYVLWYENGQKYIKAYYDQGMLNGKC